MGQRAGVLRRAMSGRIGADTIGPHERQTMPAGSALLVVLVALLLGGLLNVQSLIDAAERQPNGWTRDTALIAVWPFRQVSDLLGLDQPQQLLAERLGRADDAGASSDGTGSGSDGGTSLDGDLERDPLLGDALAAAAALAGREAVDTTLGSATAIPVGVDGDAVAVPEGAPGLSERLTATFTEESPLQVAVVGDSLTEQLGPTLISRASRPGSMFTATHDFTVSSGLTRPDFYDWPARIEQLTDELDPDIWVMMIGANDAQDIRNEGRFISLGSDEWEAIYRGRVGAMMESMSTDGRGVIWVGQPIMRGAQFDDSMAYLSNLYAREAAARPQVSFVDARAVFAGDDGGYADYLPAVTGQLVQVRLGDGIHMTRAGAERLVGQILPLLPVDPVG